MQADLLVVQPRSHGLQALIARQTSLMQRTYTTQPPNGRDPKLNDHRQGAQQTDPSRRLQVTQVC